MGSNRLGVCGLLVCAGLSWCARPAAAQASATGAVEFEAVVMASGGVQPEPARQLSFYLLRKDLADIRKEAEQAQPLPDMDHFIDSLEVSPALKVWMKKNHTTEFTGTAFVKSLKAADIMDIPEFLEAYKNLNAAVLNATLPASQVKESDRTKNPEKYQRAKDKYTDDLRQYIVSNPQSLDGLDAELTDKDFGRRWAQILADQKRHAEDSAMILAQTQYLAAKSESDLNGRGSFAGLAPGTYWITSLGVSAMAGDTRLQWDVPVVIRAGQTTRLTLSNVNALARPERMAH